MTWLYFCSEDGMTLSADSKEELADKLMEHAKTAHDMRLSREDAADMVEQNATRKAA